MRKLGFVSSVLGLLLLAAALVITANNLLEDKKAGQSSAQAVEELINIINSAGQNSGTAENGAYYLDLQHGTASYSVDTPDGTGGQYAAAPTGSSSTGELDDTAVSALNSSGQDVADEKPGTGTAAGSGAGQNTDNHDTSSNNRDRTGTAARTGKTSSLEDLYLNWESTYEQPEEDMRMMPTTVIQGYAYIGVLEIPYLNRSLPVMDTWDYNRLRKAPCLFYGTVYRNNMVIIAHNYQEHFSPLKTAPIGSEIIFTDVDGIRYEYEVASIETLSPDQIELLLEDEWDLTLLTCNLGGKTRCAIRCVLADR